MRIDLFLKASGIIKRRTVAKQMCDGGFVFINDRKASASANIRVGDVITIYFKLKKVSYKVLEVPEKIVSREKSQFLYEILSEEYYEN